jgi:nitroimidazol reductase NimA-like FMN-containing flavoprotein (pyridoxamine 5'-phosphate oxidase superfamily)
MGSRPVVEMLSAGECRAYLAQVAIGRVAVTVGALPVIFTVPFVLDGDDLLIRVAQLSVLRRALTGSVVAFSADDFEESEEDSWSVLVRGVGEAVGDEAVGDEALAASSRALPLRSCSEAPEHDCFVRLPLTQLSGTRAHWPDAPAARPGAKAPVGAGYRVPA